MNNIVKMAPGQSGVIKKRKKALSVSPLKTSQTVGGALAVLGVARAVPLMHGSQGCTAFAKVFFVRHFREPVPLQTTAMDQVSSVMGADDNIVEALKVICEKSAPALIGLVTTGLAETQGADIKRAVGEFRKQYPQFVGTAVTAVNTPDFSGSFESGFALTVKGILQTLVPEVDPEAPRAGLRHKQINVLCGANLSPTDLEFVAESIESFGLRPLLIPDLSGSLDGHLADEPFSPVTTGGVTVADIATAGESLATLAVGESLHSCAQWLEKHTAVPTHCFGHLMGLESVDQWFHTLSQLSGRPVPERWVRQRKQLQDAMLDTHFMLGLSRVAIASDPDMLTGFTRLLQGMGAEVVTAVVPTQGPALKTLHDVPVQVGDLEDLEMAAAASGAQLLLTNSHGAESAERLGIPLFRIGFPQYDVVGGFQRCWFGYRGTSQALFDLANLVLSQHHELEPYHSRYSQKHDAVPAGSYPGDVSSH
ncbi:MULTISPECIES: nitrogenase iron-molybdenum cofactor biosynthesis protein NifN [unclassified Oceanobacter]|jgi:nitrogenase molybdenum-iron protein NifN|uniref:nitrogenase iron-molybdenum cofactor biosynthesis protein NifN n=1 Tax=unclassified Oceanobacter TaxID=2620260 RepID=UPI0027345447|nr:MULTISPECIES: nitrogenase iron-molybdenum cofactor biosynthesis protein NifN [unclassified Oceanobacter]MDP2549132.1 nitrogenase iron-molybdenum cofactor biosynthesis protein NifN [Oceanobacter sp. 4_MG-2023]MDP2609042.1 nitrogenase iron-molybdenum cofactor biosynthesis protein NifN [Oceanobacter sp. 1_MG-2023]MDP2612364.1 nitrogenase iron-molybdenum cofactor biosynthesis protein NifN [Oceanobacter sp. 2_MG-2023]